MTTLLTLLLAFVVMVLAMAAMAIGVMARRAPIRGSCGGLIGVNGSGCELCSGRCETAASEAEQWR